MSTTLRIWYYEGKANEDNLGVYAQARRDIFLKYVDKRTIKNMNQVAKADPSTILETDKFFRILKELENDNQAMKGLLLVCFLLR